MVLAVYQNQIQELSRTIQRIYKENWIKSNRQFYKHIWAGSVQIRQFSTFKH